MCIKINDVSAHQDKCEMKTVECKNRGCTGYARRDKNSHYSICQYREINCDYCKTKIIACKKSEHLNECPHAIIHCKWSNICISSYEFKEAPSPEPSAPPVPSAPIPSAPVSSLYPSLDESRSVEKVKSSQQSVYPSLSEPIVIRVLPVEPVEDNSTSIPSQVSALERKFCDYQCKRKNMKKHEDICKYRIIDCKNKSAGCNVQFNYCDSKIHNQECNFKLTSCKLCGNELLKYIIPKHLTICPENEQPCKWGCGIKIKNKNMESHGKFCEHFLIECKCGERIKKNEIWQHNNIHCANTIILCSCNDKIMRKNIDSHRENKCPNTIIICVCGKRIANKNLKMHADADCPDTIINCNCGDNIIRKNHGQHLNKDCPNAIIVCKCNGKIMRKDMKDHNENKCPNTIITCDCGEKIMIKNIEGHNKNTCPNVTIDCDCKEKILRKDMKSHLDNDCKAIHSTCELCKTKYNKEKADHFSVCTKVYVLCKYSFGLKCLHQSPREDVEEHEKTHDEKQMKNVQYDEKTRNKMDYHIGTYWDVCDKDGRWYAGRIIEKKENIVLINFIGWDEKYNEWVNIKQKLVPYRFITKDDKHIGQKVHVKYSNNIYYESIITDISYKFKNKTVSLTRVLDGSKIIFTTPEFDDNVVKKINLSVGQFLIVLHDNNWRTCRIREITVDHVCIQIITSSDDLNNDNNIYKCSHYDVIHDKNKFILTSFS
jgi:hypothetical protein